MRSVTPGCCCSRAGPACLNICSSEAPSEMATRPCGMALSSAASADAYSAGSRNTRSGCHSAHAARRCGSIARTLSPAKISPITIASASSRETVGTRPQAAPSSSSGGTSPSEKR